MPDDELTKIVELLERRGPHADAAGRPAEASAREWLASGFEEAEEVEGWLAARCFTAESARALEEAGLTPEQAAIRTREGAGDYEDTLGYKITNGDLSLEEARRIITRDFWDT